MTDWENSSWAVIFQRTLQDLLDLIKSMRRWAVWLQILFLNPIHHYFLNYNYKISLIVALEEFTRMEHVGQNGIKWMVTSVLLISADESFPCWRIFSILVPTPLIRALLVITLANGHIFFPFHYVCFSYIKYYTESSPTRKKHTVLSVKRVFKLLWF